MCLLWSSSSSCAITNKSAGKRAAFDMWLLRGAMRYRRKEMRSWTTNLQSHIPPPALPRKHASPDATRSYREIRLSASCWMWDMLLMNVYGEDMYNRFFLGQICTIGWAVTIHTCEKRRGACWFLIKFTSQWTSKQFYLLAHAVLKVEHEIEPNEL